MDHLKKSLREFALFQELFQRASPRQIQIALYVMRLHFEQQQAPSARVDADIQSVQKAIDTGCVDEFVLPSLH